MRLAHADEVPIRYHWSTPLTRRAALRLMVVTAPLHDLRGDPVAHADARTSIDDARAALREAVREAAS